MEVLGAEPRTPCRPGARPAAEPHPPPSVLSASGQRRSLLWLESNWSEELQIRLCNRPHHVSPGPTLWDRVFWAVHAERSAFWAETRGEHQHPGGDTAKGNAIGTEGAWPGGPGVTPTPPPPHREGLRRTPDRRECLWLPGEGKTWVTNSAPFD